jgi:phenylpropionate dioxygenase-like ring-hydroxylating dioxygenase large terminal subunit
MTKPDEKFHTAITTQAPDMGTVPLPVEPYISAEFFEKEREKIFRRAWLEVARVEELPNPGD